MSKRKRKPDNYDTLPIPSSYDEQLLDPRWKKVRHRIISRDLYACRICNSALKPLHVHHLRYPKGKPVWDIPDTELIALCRLCHDLFHDVQKGRKPRPKPFQLPPPPTKQPEQTVRTPAPSKTPSKAAQARVEKVANTAETRAKEIRQQTAKRRSKLYKGYKIVKKPKWKKGR